MYQNVNSELLLNLPLILWKKIEKKIMLQSGFTKKKVRLS